LCYTHEQKLEEAIKKVQELPEAEAAEMLLSVSSRRSSSPVHLDDETRAAYKKANARRDGASSLPTKTWMRSLGGRV
jgi:hypothetical protein